MCWCFTHAHASLDVDVLFRPSATTGQNVRLAEKIVRVLRDLGCPEPLQAHQIQGGDQCPGKPAAVVDFWSDFGRFCSKLDRNSSFVDRMTSEEAL